MRGCNRHAWRCYDRDREGTAWVAPAAFAQPTH